MMKVQLELTDPVISLDCDLDDENESNLSEKDDDEALKEWLWKHHGKDILRSLKVTRKTRRSNPNNGKREQTKKDHDDDDDGDAAPVTSIVTEPPAPPATATEESSSSSNSSHTQTTAASTTTTTTQTPETTESSETTTATTTTTTTATPPPPTTTTTALVEDNDNHDQHRRLELLDTIAQVQRVFLETESMSKAFGVLLTGLLSMVNSEYGFIGEVKYTDCGDMYLQIHSRASLELMNTQGPAREFFERNEKEAVNLYNLHSLFGECLLTKQVVVSNQVALDPRSGGVPPGHPTLNRFLGVPFFAGAGASVGDKKKTILGLVGVANKHTPEGYTDQDVALLGPFVLTCSSVIQAARQIKRNENLINDLERKVQERTIKLQRANQELEEANRRVLRASAAQLEHFACMSHEIRTPLNCIIGLSSLLQESGSGGSNNGHNNGNSSNGNGDLTPMQEEAVRMIVSSGDLLLTVVNDVLDYSKLETGNVEIDIQRSSLQEALNAVVHSIVIKAQGKQIRLRTLYHVALPEFWYTDGRRVQQILYNLLGNSLKFSPAGSVIDLKVQLLTQQERDQQAIPDSFSPSSVDMDMAAPLRTGVATRRPSFWNNSHHSSTTTITSHYQHQQQQQQYLRFTVKDYGQGIARDDYERIFEPFRQATYETDQVYGGTGLGLAITAKLVHGLGGTICVDSVEGSWSRFTVDLPFFYGGGGTTGMGGVEEQQLLQQLPPIPAVISSTANVLQSAAEPLTRPEEPVTIVFVCNDEEVAQPVLTALQVCQIPHARFQSCAELEAELARTDDSNHLDWLRSDPAVITTRRTHVFLVQEDLFRSGTLNALSSTCSDLDSGVVLLTFGPRFEVPQCYGHFRSLVQMIPCVLIRSIATFVTKFRLSSAGGTTTTPEQELEDDQEPRTPDMMRNNIREQDMSLRSSNHAITGLPTATTIQSPSLSLRSSGGSAIGGGGSTSLVSVVAATTNAIAASKTTATTTTTEDEPSQNRGYQTYSILIAEDNKINQKVLVRMLTRIGIQNVNVVENGQEAVDAEAAKQYDVIFMDMQMPVMDGLEACEIIVERGIEEHDRPQQQQQQQQQQPYRPPSIVFVTAHVSLEAKCLKAGAVGFLPKPFNLSGIEQCLQNVHALRDGGHSGSDSDLSNSLVVDGSSTSISAPLGLMPPPPTPTPPPQQQQQSQQQHPQEEELQANDVNKNPTSPTTSASSLEY